MQCGDGYATLWQMAFSKDSSNTVSHSDVPLLHSRPYVHPFELGMLLWLPAHWEYRNDVWSWVVKYSRTSTCLLRVILWHLWPPCKQSDCAEAPGCRERPKQQMWSEQIEGPRLQIQSAITEYPQPAPAVTRAVTTWGARATCWDPLRCLVLSRQIIRWLCIRTEFGCSFLYSYD